MVDRSSWLDDPKTTVTRQSALSQDSYLRRLYEDWYRLVLSEIPLVQGEVLELGSGGGFLRDVFPKVTTSDVMQIPGVDLQVDARRLPFADGSLRAIVGTNVLHHIPDIEQFFSEAQRTLVAGGRFVFIEPWPTLLSRPIYQHLHHEPFDETRDWSICAGGPLTAANGALPWIVFERDRAEFEGRFPGLFVRGLKRLMPVSYILSGGIERNWAIPSWLFPVARTIERPFDALGLFALVTIERRPRHDHL